MAVDVGSAKGYLDLDISGFLAGLKTAQTEADNTSKNISTRIGKNLTGIGKNLTSVGTSLTKNVTLPIGGMGFAIVKTSADFESAMSKVQAISGATGADFDKLNAKAQEMGAKTKFSATESAEAFTYMAMAGWKTEDMLAGIDGIMNLAAADGLDLATTSDIVTDALTAFGLGAEDSAHFADVLAKASSSANTNVSMLGESFKYVAPVAGALGYSAEDTAVALGLMANAGIKGSQSGTALRASLSRLIKPADDAAALMEEYNLSLTNSDGTMKSLGEVMDMLRTNLGELTEAEQAQIAAELFGQEAMSGMLSIINASEKDYKNLTNQIHNADGAAQQMADTMLNNLSGQITILKSSIEGLALQFGEILLPYVKQGVEWFQNLVQKFQELSTEQKEQIVKWAAIAAAVGPALVVLGKIVSTTGSMFTAFGKIPGAITKMKTGFTTLGTNLKNVSEGFSLAKAGYSGLAAQSGSFGAKIGASLAGVTGPMIAIVAAVALVIAAFVSLWKNNEDFRNKITAIWNKIKETFNKFAQGIVDRLNSLGFNFESITDVLKAIWEGFCNFLAPIFEGIFNNIAIYFEFITNHILNIVDFFIAIFKGDWEGAWEAIKNIFLNIWNYIKNWFSNILNVIKGVLDVVLGWFGTSWSQCWNGIKTFFINIWNSIVSWFTNTLNNIKTFFQNVWNNVSSWFRNTLNSIKTFFVNTWKNIKTFFTNVLNGIKTFFVNIWNSIKTTFTNVLNSIKTFFVNIWNSIKTFFVNTWNSIKNTVSTVIKAIKTTISNVWNSVKTTTTSVWNFIKNAISNPINAAKNIVTSVVNSIKSIISNGFTAAKNTVSSIFDSIKSKINSVMEGAKSIVTNAVSKLKSAFNFSWSLPKLKLPHISVTGGEAPYGIGGQGSLPKFSISWYKKAMSGGMILNSPTIFGYDENSSHFLGAGEAGSEVVVGTASLLKMIRQAVTDAIKPMVAMTYQLARASVELGYITYDGFTKQKQIESKILGFGDNRDSGDTFNFYSPKPIDEIEAAKQMKKTKRELAEGF